MMPEKEKGGIVRSLTIGCILTGISLMSVFVVGEIVCRLFFPDTQLHYVSDPGALYYFEPNQTGSLQLNNGASSPPMHINHLGFRGPEVKDGGRKVLVLGDSFTFGSGVRDEETFVARLNQWLSEDVTVVNGGQPGYGVFQMAATLTRVGERLRPEVVVVVLWQGDLLRQPPDASEREKFLIRQERQKLAKSSVFLTQVYRRIERVLLRFGLTRYVYHVGDGGSDRKPDSKTVVDRSMEGWLADSPRLAAMHEESRRYGAGLVLVLWPKEGYAGEAEEGLAAKLTDTLGLFARQHDIPFISLQAAMQQSQPGALLIPGDYHPTPLAHCLAAKEIGVELMRLGKMNQYAAVSCGAAQL